MLIATTYIIYFFWFFYFECKEDCAYSPIAIIDSQDEGGTVKLKLKDVIYYNMHVWLSAINT